MEHLDANVILTVRGAKMLSQPLMSMRTIDGDVVKEDDRYLVRDNTQLKNLVVSSTKLKPGKATSGHFHKGQEEVYMFIEGGGHMTLGEKRFQIREGQMVLIEDGIFHKVEAGDEGAYFVCVFDGGRHTEVPNGQTSIFDE